MLLSLSGISRKSSLAAVQRLGGGNRLITNTVSDLKLPGLQRRAGPSPDAPSAPRFQVEKCGFYTVSCTNQQRGKIKKKEKKEPILQGVLHWLFFIAPLTTEY